MWALNDEAWKCGLDRTLYGHAIAKCEVNNYRIISWAVQSLRVVKCVLGNCGDWIKWLTGIYIETWLEPSLGKAPLLSASSNVNSGGSGQQRQREGSKKFFCSAIWLSFNSVFGIDVQTRVDSFGASTSFYFDLTFVDHFFCVLLMMVYVLKMIVFLTSFGTEILDARGVYPFDLLIGIGAWDESLSFVVMIGVDLLISIDSFWEKDVELHVVFQI